MAERNLFQLLDFDPSRPEDRERVDGEAIIAAVQRAPFVTEVKFDFLVGSGYPYYQSCRVSHFPLHQAIMLKAPLGVIDALSTPRAIRLRCDIDTSPLHLACHYRTSVDVIMLLMKKYPKAIKQRGRHGATILHAAAYGTSFDAISLILRIWPESVKTTNRFGQTPLYIACKHNAPVEVASLLLNSWPEASKITDKNGEGLLHLLFKNHSARMEVILLLLDAWLGKKENRTKKDMDSLKKCYCSESRADVKKLLRFVTSTFYGDNAKNNSEVQKIKNHFIRVKWGNGLALLIDKYPNRIERYGDALDILSLLLKSWSEAIRVKSKHGNTPVCMIRLKKAVFHQLELWLMSSRMKGRNGIRTLKRRFYNDAPDGFKKLLDHISSLYISDERNKPSPNETMTLFVSIGWWKGVLLLIRKYPAAVKATSLHASVMPEVLAMVGRRYKLATMWELIRNEQVLLANV